MSSSRRLPTGHTNPDCQLAVLTVSTQHDQYKKCNILVCTYFAFFIFARVYLLVRVIAGWWWQKINGVPRYSYTNQCPWHNILDIRFTASISHCVARYGGTSAHWIIVKRWTTQCWSGQPTWWTDLPMRYDDVVTDVLPHSQPSSSSSLFFSASVTAPVPTLQIGILRLSLHAS